MMQSGDALFRHHRQLTARLAGRVGVDEAEDLASEAVARSLARPAPDGRQAPWLETIFRNLLADRGRRWARRRWETCAGDGDSATATPEELVLAAERRRAVAAALPGMPAELREAVEARFLAGQDYEQFAAGRGITPTTARTRVHRGLARLRRALAGVRALSPVGPGLGAVAPALAVALLMATPAPPVEMAPRPASVASRAAGIARGTTIAASDAPAPHATQPADRAPATERRPKAVVPTDDDTPAAVKRLDFEDDEVDGDLQRPGIILIDGDPRQRRLGSLIDIPRSFEPSMTKMIEDL